MTKPAGYIPKHCQHKAKALGFVRIEGRAIYTGSWGTPEAQAKYERIIAELLAQRRAKAQGVPPPPTSIQVEEYLVKDLVADYLDHLGQRFPPPSKEPQNIGYAMRDLLPGYGDGLAIQFTPRCLVAYRDRLRQLDLCRRMVNRRVNFVRRMFRWAVEHELLPAHIWHALQAVEPIRRGTYQVRESEPVHMVSRDAVEAILPLVSRQVRAMIEIQWATGLRPGEVVSLRKADIRIEGQSWRYVVENHKNKHRGMSRVVPIPTWLRPALTSFLLRPEGYLFDPREADAEYRACRRQGRTTPMTPSHRKRQAAAFQGSKRPINDHYSTESYGRCIARACKKTAIPPWSPNQLRHTAATQITRRVGLEKARVVLGHRSTKTTEIYAELDFREAERALEELGSSAALRAYGDVTQSEGQENIAERGTMNEQNRSAST